MNEYSSASSELDDSSEAKIQHLMDKLGISHSEAQARLGLGGVAATGFSALESRQLHPSIQAPARQYRHYESRYDGEAFPVIDNSELSNEERAINSAAIAAIREANRVPYDQRTPQQHAMYRAEDDRRSKNLK